MVGRSADRATRLHMSPGLQALFRLIHRMTGSLGSKGLVDTMNALVEVDFRYNHAALLLGITPEALRQRVHSIKNRAMEVLKDTSYSIPVVKSVDENLVFGADDRAYEIAPAAMDVEEDD